MIKPRIPPMGCVDLFLPFITYSTQPSDATNTFSTLNSTTESDPENVRPDAITSFVACCEEGSKEFAHPVIAPTPASTIIRREIRLIACLPYCKKNTNLSCQQSDEKLISASMSGSMVVDTNSSHQPSQKTALKKRRSAFGQQPSKERGTFEKPENDHRHIVLHCSECGHGWHTARRADRQGIGTKTAVRFRTSSIESRNAQ